MRTIDNEGNGVLIQLGSTRMIFSSSFCLLTLTPAGSVTLTYHAPRTTHSPNAISGLFAGAATIARCVN